MLLNIFRTLSLLTATFQRAVFRFKPGTGSGDIFLLLLERHTVQNSLQQRRTFLQERVLVAELWLQYLLGKFS